MDTAPEIKVPILPLNIFETLSAGYASEFDNENDSAIFWTPKVPYLEIVLLICSCYFFDVN